MSDITSLTVGAMGWAMAIMPVKMAGQGVATDNYLNKVFALVFGVGLAYSTTPLLSTLLGWKTKNDKVRGVALALGAAQVIDGIVHIFYPSFYHDDPNVGLGCAGNIFFGAGILGIFSAYQ